MEKRWKNLLVVSAVLIAAAFFLYYYFSYLKTGIVGNYVALLSLMEKYGVDASKFSHVVAGVSKLSDSQLENLSNELKDFSNRADEAWLKEIALIYADIADLQRNKNGLESLQFKAEDVLTNPCDKLAIFSEMKTKGDNIESIASDLFKRSSKFVSEYPDKAEELGVFVIPNPTDLAEIRKAHKMQSSVIEALKVMCK